MSIQKYLDKIKDAVFGKDIREAIYNSIKQCYDDAAINNEDSVRPLNLNNGAKSIQPIAWRISESSVIKNDSSLTIGSNIGCLYRDKFIYVTPNTYLFDSTDRYLILRNVKLQINPTETHTPIIVRRVDINENDIILAYYSAQIITIWDGIIAEYRSNLNNVAKSVEPLIWKISEDSIVKNAETITISSNVGVVYRDKFIYVTPNSYTFDSTDSYLILRDVTLQTNPSETHTPIMVKRNNINENDIILAYYSAQIVTIWDGIIAEYRSQINKNILSVPFTTERRTPLGGYGYISSRYPFNIDTVNKKIIFNAETFICYNANFIKIKNTVVDITNTLRGGHLYYDITKQDFITTKPSHENFIVLGTIWINPLVIGLNTTNGFTVNGMFYNQTISRWNGEVLNAIGDSITYGVGCTIQYHQWLKQLCGFKTVNNYGVSGSTIARRPNNSISWDTAIALVDRINLIDKNAKVNTVFMGVNDFITGRLLGTFNSTDVTTFYGALHYVCKYFRENMPDKIVTFITPMQFNWKLRPPVGNNTDGTNKNGNTLLDFVNAIKEVCGYYGYTVLDMYHNCFYGLSDTTVETFMPDKLHVNDLGHKEIMAPRIASHINSH